MQGISIADILPYLLYYVRTYVLYRCVPPVLVIHVHSATYGRIYLGYIRGHDYVHTRNFSKKYRHVFTCMLVLSAQMYVHAIMQQSVHVASVHTLTQYYVHVLPRASLLVLLRVYVSMHRLLRAPVPMTSQESVLMVAFTNVCLSLCPTSHHGVIPMIMSGY